MQSKQRKQTIRKKEKSKPTFFEAVPCPICGKEDFAILRAGIFPEDLSEAFLAQVYRASSDGTLFEQVVRCQHCHGVYLNPRLKPELIIDSYSQGEDQSFIDQDAMRIRTFEKALKRLSRAYPLSLSPDTKVLDIGCAGGAFLHAAENMGLSATGIEPNRWLTEYAQSAHQLDARSGTLADYTFEADTFDLVTLWDVIEHVPNPSAELQEIYRILKPGGLLVVNYPDFHSLPARLLGRKWPFWLSVHLTYYTPETIRRHLHNHGFTVEAIKPHWQTLELGYVLKRMIPYISFMRWPKTAIERVGLGHMPVTYWMGQTQVIAQKRR